MKDDFKKVNSFLKAYLRSNGLEESFIERDLIKLWPKLVGPLFARYTKSLHYRRGVVYISMTSAMARNELQMKKTTLIDTLNEGLGEKSIKDIMLR